MLKLFVGDENEKYFEGVRGCALQVLSSGPTAQVRLMHVRPFLTILSEILCKNKIIYANLKYEKGTTQLVYVYGNV